MPIIETYEEREKRLSITKPYDKRMEIYRELGKIQEKDIQFHNILNQNISLSSFKFKKDKELLKRLRQNAKDLRMNTIALKRRLAISSKGTTN